MQGWHQQPCNTSHPHAIAAGPFNEILNETNRESGFLTLLVSEDEGFSYVNGWRWNFFFFQVLPHTFHPYQTPQNNSKSLQKCEPYFCLERYLRSSAVKVPCAKPIENYKQPMLGNILPHYPVFLIPDLKWSDNVLRLVFSIITVAYLFALQHDIHNPVGHAAKINFYPMINLSWVVWRKAPEKILSLVILFVFLLSLGNCPPLLWSLF